MRIQEYRGLWNAKENMVHRWCQYLTQSRVTLGSGQVDKQESLLITVPQCGLFSGFYSKKGEELIPDRDVLQRANGFLKQFKKSIRNIHIQISISSIKFLEKELENNIILAKSTLPHKVVDKFVNLQKWHYEGLFNNIRGKHCKKFGVFVHQQQHIWKYWETRLGY